MKILFIGGTGTISMAITRQLAAEGHTLYLLNRGTRSDELPEGVQVIRCDISDEDDAAEKLRGMEFDCVGICDASADNFPDEEFLCRILYVMMTRPLHRLCLWHRGEPSPLLPESARKDT